MILGLTKISRREQLLKADQFCPRLGSVHNLANRRFEIRFPIRSACRLYYGDIESGIHVFISKNRNPKNGTSKFSLPRSIPHPYFNVDLKRRRRDIPTSYLDVNSFNGSLKAC